MTPSDIISAIAKAGTSQSAIASYLGVRPASVGRVIRGQMRSKRIETELAKIVGKPIDVRPLNRPGRPKTVWTGKVGQVGV